MLNMLPYFSNFYGIRKKKKKKTLFKVKQGVQRTVNLLKIRYMNSLHFHLSLLAGGKYLLITPKWRMGMRAKRKSQLKC